MSFEIILPFLRPIAHLITDQGISEIMVNGNGAVFCERRGRIELVDIPPLTQKNLEIAIKNIARRLGDDVNEEKPILDARLPDGSRVAAVLPPCSVGGITLTIRKFNGHRWSLTELVSAGAISPDLVQILTHAIHNSENILISGGTGSGKTTMLNALASLIPSAERLVVIEDTAEIQLTAPNLVRFEARRAQEGLAAVEIRDLLKATLRHRPDRIILGEIRGGEAFDLLQALNTGHSGSLSTIHANNSRQALSRFLSCILQSGVELPYKAIQSLISLSVNYVLQVARLKDGTRRVTELARITDYNADTDKYGLDMLYQMPTQRHPVPPSSLLNLSAACDSKELFPTANR